MTSPSLPPRLTGPSRFLTPGWENLTTSVWTLGKKVPWQKRSTFLMFWRLASNFGFGPCLEKNVRSAVHRWSNGPGNVLTMKTTSHLQWLVGVLLLQLDVEIYPQPWKPPDSFPWIVATTHFRCATRGRCRFASSTPAMIEIKWWVGYIKSLLVLRYITLQGTNVFPYQRTFWRWFSFS